MHFDDGLGAEYPKQTKTMSNIKLILEAWNEGEFDTEIKMAVLTIDESQIYRMSVLAADLKAKHPDFSELRLFSTSAQYYLVSADDVFDTLEDKPALGCTAERAEEMRRAYRTNAVFVWPSDLDLDTIISATALTPTAEPVSVDVAEFVGDEDVFYFTAEVDIDGKKEVKTQELSYKDILNRENV